MISLDSPITCVEAYLIHDSPVLFHGKDEHGNSYLCVWADYDQLSGIDSYVCAPVSAERLSALETNQITLYNAFRYPEGGVVRIDEFLRGAVRPSRLLAAAKLPEDWLPDRDCYLMNDTGVEV